MKFTVAIILVIASLASAEPPRFRSFARQTVEANGDSAPYEPRGWRPAGAAFNLPQKSQAPQQTYGAPAPQQKYGPPAAPSNQYGPAEPEETTTDADIEVGTDTPPQVENIRNADKKSEKLQEPQNPAFFIIPQPERLVYAVQPAPLVALPQTKILTAANLQALPLTSYQTPVLSQYSQYTGSYVQVYQ